MLTRLLLAPLIGAILAYASAQAAVLSVLPSSQTVNSGDTLSVDLRMSDLGDGTSPSIGVFDIDLLFDPLLLSFGSATYGTGLDVLGLGSLQIATLGVGSVNLFELSFDTIDDLNTLQPAAFTLATLTFTALADGTSVLTLFVNALGDAEGSSLPATLQNGSVTVGSPPPTPVPEPESYALLLAGLFILGSVVRSRFKANGFYCQNAEQPAVFS